MSIACGVTTVSTRCRTVLPLTLGSLHAAGFERPRLFADGIGHDEALRLEVLHGTPVTSRYPLARTWLNWLWALEELYGREPTADKYVVFQDDVKAPRNLREYLERSAMDPKTYWNLWTHPTKNQPAAGGRRGWFPARGQGIGALGLVFDREGVRQLLQHRHTVERCSDAKGLTPIPKRDLRGGDPNDPWTYGQKNVDGAVRQALGVHCGYTELCHNPSLLGHRNGESSMHSGTMPAGVRMAESFPGEEFDCTTLKEV